MTDWISTQDKLPTPFVSVLAHVPDKAPLPTVHEGYVDSDGDWHLVHCFYQTSVNVANRMELPKPPEKKD